MSSGIYISGLEMPENYRHMILMANGDVTDSIGIKIATAIELPPHGRLIDADALLDDCIFSDEGFKRGMYAFIGDASTIIPADPGKGGK